MHFLVVTRSDDLSKPECFGSRGLAGGNHDLLDESMMKRQRPFEIV
jgi:hypothetical protein